VRSLFNFCGDFPTSDSNIVLIQPARMSILPNGQKWKLEEKGSLSFYNHHPTFTLSTKLVENLIEPDTVNTFLQEFQENYKKLELEIQQISEERNQFYSELKKYQADYQQLEAKFQHIYQEREEISLQMDLIKMRLDLIEIQPQTAYQQLEAKFQRIYQEREEISLQIDLIKMRLDLIEIQQSKEGTQCDQSFS
jgi:chromosome segregation ATPase